MKFPDKHYLRILLLFIGLIVVSCSAIWSVEYYFNQDGSPHLYNAYLILELLKGNDSIAQFAMLNPHLVPNLTGHWILAFLLVIFEPATATKIMVTLTFALFVASVGWLRFQVAGKEGLGTALLLGTVLAFNWLWFWGFYNYILAATCFSFSLGLWWRWRQKMNFLRFLILFPLLIFTFYSHLISFGFLIAAIGFLLTANYKSIPKKSAAWTVAVIASTMPLLINYLYFGHTGGAIEPEWNYLKNPLSISNWWTHFVATDPFSLISRKAVPFVEFTSPVFALFSSTLSLVIALLLLAHGTFGSNKAQKRNLISEQKSWIVLAMILIMIWALGPDGFGKVHGGFLRERTLILALVCFVPFFRINGNRVILLGAQACLILIILFQTLVLWDYAHYAEPLGKQFLEAKDHIGPNDSVGSIIFVSNTRRFRPMPLSNITPLLGIGKNAPIWDNFEFGNYYFPVVTKTSDEREFVFNFRESNTYDLNDPNENVAEKRSRLESVLIANHNQIDILLVWNEQPDFDSLREKWFEIDPYFESAELKLFKHRR